MKFATIEPAQATLRQVEAEDLETALRLAGLKPGEVDHGLVWPAYPGSEHNGLAIVVSQFGLYEPVERQRYFSIDRQLFAGNAVLYAIDEDGYTVDVTPDDVPALVFYPSVDGIERAIANYEIARPTFAVNGVIKWQWPQPRPDLDAIAASVF